MPSVTVDIRRTTNDKQYTDDSLTQTKKYISLQFTRNRERKRKKSCRKDANTQLSTIHKKLIKAHTLRCVSSTIRPVK